MSAIEYGGLRGTSFDSPNPATGVLDPNSALAQAKSQYPISRVLFAIENGTVAAWALLGENSFTIPSTPPPGWSQADLQAFLAGWTGWFNFSVALSSTTVLSPGDMASAIQQMKSAVQLGMRVKVWDALLASLAKQAGVVLQH